MYGIDSLQTVLKSFLIEKLKKSLDLSTANELLFATPKDLMRDNENNIFETMRNNVPCLVLNDKQLQQKQEDANHSPLKVIHSMTETDENGTDDLSFAINPRHSITSPTTEIFKSDAFDIVHSHQISGNHLEQIMKR